MIDRKDADPAGAAMSFEEALEFRPGFLLKGAKVPGKAEAIDNGCQALSMFDWIGFRIGNPVFCARLDIVG